ncbi:hypothetical protein QUF94_27935 [Peribacillus sp. NJ4]|jgi:hypothetical protein|uniref:hypothetical protein n=1 Tax=Peribacillus TaxID=2675229 RepID=UPI0025A30976|nr:MULTISPECIES: hypothetical protein [unclassified Peribacillus]MDM5215143.1 hypothetical protein [Peribacillus sp. NJ4]MDM5224432.1 hypothetical protein [Peribacillus sp. NJ11]
MGKYSQANLIDEELSLIGSSNFIGKFIHKVNKSSTVLLSIDVPLNLFLRAEVFCEDIQDLSDMHFEQNDLMNLLFNDFLLFAKKNPDSKSLFRLLTSLDQYAGKDSRLEKYGESTFKLIHKDKNQEMKTLNLRMRRKFALRGEVLLADMDEVQPEHGYTLEKVFELLYIDFIDKFRKGNHAGAVENILRLLDDEIE